MKGIDEQMKKVYEEQEKFYEKEQPELVTAKGGEIRLYKNSGRLAVSKPQWTDADGNSHMGKTVSVDLTNNKGNLELIDLLKNVVELLKEGTK